MMIRESIQELYRVFSSYGLEQGLHGCEHCIDPEDSRRLAETPLHALSLRELDSYALKAMTTWGDVAEFKHFVPRLLELAGEDLDSFTIPEVLFEKLQYGKWRSWPAQEISAIENFLRAYWTKTLSEDQSEDEIDTILCSIAQAGGAMQPFLDRWIEMVNGPAHRNLGRFVELNASAIRENGKLWNVFWEERSSQAATVVSWLGSSTTYDYLVAGRSSLTGASGIDRESCLKALGEIQAHLRNTA